MDLQKYSNMNVYHAFFHLCQDNILTVYHQGVPLKRWSYCLTWDSLLACLNHGVSKQGWNWAAGSSFWFPGQLSCSSSNPHFRLELRFQILMFLPCHKGQMNGGGFFLSLFLLSFKNIWAVHCYMRVIWSH